MNFPHEETENALTAERMDHRILMAMFAARRALNSARLAEVSQFGGRAGPVDPMMARLRLFAARNGDAAAGRKGAVFAAGQFHPMTEQGTLETICKFRVNPCDSMIGKAVRLHVDTSAYPAHCVKLED